ARVQRSLIGGAATLEFVSSDSGAGQAVAALPTDGSAIVTGWHDELIDQVANALDERLDPLATSLDRFDELTGTYNTLGQNLNDLVRPQTDDEVAAEPNIRQVVARLDAALSNVRTIFDEDFRRTLSLAEDWLGDEQMRADVRATLEQARTATESLNQTLERYDSLADELATDGDSAVGHLARTADELSRTLEEVRRVASLAAAGDGTAGELLTNPDLYHSLTDAATRLDDVLVQMQLLIEKIRAEGLRIGG
ncbi:MAG: hypothetical protein ACYTGG_12760, partial [Planctomycetota bacterium]